MKRPGYMMIREAAVRYEVSRAKLHRLVKTGRLQATKDPRDERVTLLRIEDLEAMFRFPEAEASEMEYSVDRVPNHTPGRLTPELMAQMDALRWRIYKGRKSPVNSTASHGPQRSYNSARSLRKGWRNVGHRQPWSLSP